MTVMNAEDSEQLRGPAGEELATPFICEGGNLDCGSGLLLLIRKAMNQVPDGKVLEIRSTEISVKEDLPAWCRMTRNPYLGWRPAEDHNKYFVRRGDAEQHSADDFEKAREYRWQTRIHWSQGASNAKVHCRNHTWSVGQPASFDVRDESPSAVEYVLGALGACLVMGFQIKASQQKIKLSEIEIALSGRIDNIFVFLGTETTGHSGFSEITGTVYVESDADEEILQAVWRATVAGSPVANSLTHSAAINIGMRAI